MDNGNPLAQALAETRAMLQETFSQFFDPEALNALRQQFNEIAKAAAEWAKLFEQAAPWSRECLGILASNGWYIDPDGMSMPDAFELADEFRRGATAAADSRFMAHFNDRLTLLEAGLSARFPARAHLFAAAFRAHRVGEYALSIPVLLAQADGICQELRGVQLYAKKRGGDGTKTKLSDLPDISALDGLVASWISPLTGVFPITYSPNQRGTAPATMLNRHAVLHGESVTYDSEINSCRAISLLVFAAWMLDPTDAAP